MNEYSWFWIAMAVIFGVPRCIRAFRPTNDHDVKVAEAERDVCIAKEKREEAEHRHFWVERKDPKNRG